jgi:hypothetical protein
MTSYFWGKMMLSGLIATIIGIIIVGLAIEEEGRCGEACGVGVNLGTFIALCGFIITAIFAFAFLWTWN